MMFGKKPKTEKEEIEQMFKDEEMRREEEKMAQESTRIHDEWGIGEKLITVSADAKMSPTVEMIAITDKKGNIIDWEAKKMDSGYSELCNDDTASGFFEHNDMTVLRTGASLCSSIKDLAESCRLPVRDNTSKIIGYRLIDMRPAYNMVAGEHNHIVVTSKGFQGKAASMSRSHIAISRSTGTITRRDEKSGSGWNPLKLKGGN